MPTRSVIKGPQSWLIWGTAGLFYLYEFVLRASPNVMTGDLMDHFRITSTELGFLSSFYYFAYVPLQIPCGMIVDKLGPRVIVTLSALICTLGTLLFSQTDVLWVAQTGRFFVGMGSACAFISCLKLTVDWFSPARFAFVAGLTNMMGTLGGTFACTPLALLVNHYGWQKANMIMAMIGAVVTVLCWTIIRSHPSHAITSEASENLFHNLCRISKNRQMWLAGIVGGLMYVPLSAFSELWAVPFLMSTYGVSNSVAAGVNIALFLGVATGSPFSAMMTTRSKSYLLTLRCAAIFTSLLFVMIAYAEYFPFYAMYFLFFAAGFTTSGQVLCFTYAKDHSEKAYSGTAMAFTNAVVMMGGLVFQPLIGTVLDLFWDGRLSEHGVRLYSQNSYQYAILMLPLSLFISWFLLRFSTETKNFTRA